MFRIWSKESNCWVGGLVTIFQDGTIGRYSVNIKTFDIFGKEGFEISGYTGFKDSEGKKIYKGDIVEYVDSADCSTESGYDFYEYINYGEVFWDEAEGCFDITNRNEVEFEDRFYAEKLKVIGNKYENSTLLKEMLETI